jgi:glycosyltransferase involved in cell wall biosynthesis
MRIAMVAACPFPWPRGTPIRIHRMAEALGRRGHDVHVVTYHLGGPTPTPHMSVHRIEGPSWYRRTAPGPSFAKLALLDPLLTLKLRRVLKMQAFDVIHAHHYEGLLAALFARAKRKPPLVFDSHTLLETELPHYGSRLGASFRRIAGRALDRELPPRADHVIAVSDDMRADLEGAGHLHSGRITVVSNGVEIDHFLSGPRESSDAVTLTFAGNLAPYQRIDLLLESFARVRIGNPAARLQLLTADSFKPFIAQCRRLDIEDRVEVRRVDYEQLPSELNRATVLANPRVECSGIPQKLLNYMASGTPTVSFASSAKLLEHQRSGLVVPDGDVSAFADAVLRLMGDAGLRRRLGQHAQEVIARDYSWDQVAARVEQVYARVTASP